MSVFKLSCVLMAVFLLGASSLVFGVFADDSDSAALAFQMAEAEMVSSYRAVLEAEREGANVSGLLVRLNEAGENLAKAEVAYRLGDFDEAVSFANVCYDTGEAVKIEVEGLRLEAYGHRYMDIWLRITGSIFGVIVVGFGGFWVWRVFKRRYCRRVLEMKPEVVSGES